MRLLLNGYAYGAGDDRDNPHTCTYVNTIAAAEDLDLSCRTANPTGSGIHNKLLLVDLGDEQWTHVGSLNGSENSSKMNRELALQVRSREVYDYLSALFCGDWGSNCTTPRPMGLQAERSYYYVGRQRIAVREQTATDDVLTYLHGDHLGSASLATWGQTEPTVLNRHLYLPLVLRGYEEPVAQTTPLGVTPLFSPLALPTCDSPLPTPEPPAQPSAEPEALAVAGFDPPADRVAGAVVAGSNLRYTPFGEVRTGNQEGLPTDRLYTGQRWEASIGLYDYNARHYDPCLNRFIQADTIVPEPGNPQSFNRYSYVYNNPLRYTDPSGHVREDEVDEAEKLLGQLPENGVEIKGDWGWRDARGYRYWHEGSWTLTELQVLNDTVTYVYVDLLPRFEMGEIDSLGFLMALVDYRASLGATETLVDDVSTIVLGDREVDGMVRPFLGTAPWSPVALGDTGFPEYYRDGSNQVRHFWFYVHVAYTSNSALFTNAGNGAHECNRRPFLWLNGGSGTILDRVLGAYGRDLGLGIKAGAIDYTEIDTWISQTLPGSSRTR